MNNYNAVCKLITQNTPKFDEVSSQLVAFSHYNNFSPQLLIDLVTGELLRGVISEQAEQWFRNIEDMAAIDKTHKTFFPGGIPARRVIGISAIEVDALVKIDTVISNVEGILPQVK